MKYDHTAFNSSDEKFVLDTGGWLGHGVSLFIQNELMYAVIGSNGRVWVVSCFLFIVYERLSDRLHLWLWKVCWYLIEKQNHKVFWIAKLSLNAYGITFPLIHDKYNKYINRMAESLRKDFGRNQIKMIFGVSKLLGLISWPWSYDEF